MQHSESNISLKVFISYTHADHELRKKLEEHLSSLLHSREITIWQDQEIPLGANWKEQIDTHINEADLILLLVSASFMASEFCWNGEVLKALERDKAGKARVIPIILKPVDWQNTPLGQLQSLPVGTKPVTLWDNQDDAFHNVVQGIRNTVEGLRSKLPEDALGVAPRPLQQPSLPLYRRLPRRVVLGLVAVTAAGSGLTWLMVSQGLQNAPHAPISNLNPGIKGKWVATGSILEGRYGFCATTLKNGKVLIKGGNNANGQYLTESELFDVSTGTWTRTGSLNLERSDYTATLLQDGGVLVVGGFAGSPLPNAELYDPIKGTWTPSDNLNQGRTRHTATLLKNGKVLVAGGWNGDPMASAEIYDPDASRWSSAGNMITSRTNHIAVLLADGKVLVVGGEQTNNSPTGNAELYDPATNMWLPTGSMKTPRSLFAGILLPNRNVLAIGGNTPDGSTASADLYDPVTGLWSPTGGMKHKRNKFGAFLLDDGRVLVVGGDDFEMGISTSEIYLFEQGTWTALTDISQVHYSGAAALLNDGQALIIGGTDNFPPSRLTPLTAIYTPD